MKNPGELRKERREQNRKEQVNPRPEEEIVLAESSATADENPEPNDVPVLVEETNRNYSYPLRGISGAPAKITFTAHKIDGIFDLENYIDKPIRERLIDEANEQLDEIRDDAERRAAQETEEQQGIIKSFLKSYENMNADNPVGSVTLPMFRGLQYQDGVQYNQVDIGLLGAAGDMNQVSMDNGRLSGAAKALAVNAAGKALPAAAGGLASAALGKIAGGGALVAGGIGAIASGNVADQTGAIASAATRVATAPNERVLFEKVNMRSFQFTFKMIAKSREEQREIKNIIRFFRQEVYPEAIKITPDGAPFAYEFPNVFTIDIKNRSGYNPGFDIQRCYLQDVNTTFNATATGLYDGTEFIEADVALTFREISALDKSKIRKGF